MTTCNYNRVGHVASILYRGSIKNREILDDHSQGEPLKVLLGARQVPCGIENMLYEMNVGEERTAELPPEMAYGLYSEKRRSWYPRYLINNGYQLVHDSAVSWTDPKNGTRLQGFVVSTTQDAVEIDFNHPLAGKTLEYWVKLVDLK